MNRAEGCLHIPVPGGAAPEGIVKLLLLRDRKDLHNSLVAFHVVTRHLGP